jgi:hypothetical protein
LTLTTALAIIPDKSHLSNQPRSSVCRADCFNFGVRLTDYDHEHFSG